MLPANKHKAKRNEKYIKFWQLALELRENTWVQSIVGKVHGSSVMCYGKLDGYIVNWQKTEPTIRRTVAEMQKTFLVDSDIIIRKALIGLVQTEEQKMWN